MAEHTGQPKYQELAASLRRAISAGRYPVGAELPSTARLTESFGVSTTVVRAAIRELRGEGLVVGQPGKGVYVRAAPTDAGAPAAGGGETEFREFVRQALEDIETRLRRLEAERRAGPAS